MATPPITLVSRIQALLPELERVYTDIHAHPELSMQETRTAAIAADRLRSAGYEVTEGIGTTGVVGLLRNGDGPTVMLRADMDALPVREQTGLPYASTQTATDGNGNSVPVMHACGHDMHVTWLIGAAVLLAEAREAWKGTLMLVFQPAEETGRGARAMVDAGLLTRFPKPAVVLGQHVMVGPAGSVGTRAGVITSAGDSLQIRMFGRGAHGSMPHASIDPVVMAAATVLRLQTIVSRELAASDAAVVTVGSFQAGDKANVIPDEALIKLNVRTFSEDVRARVLGAITRIANAEAAASGAPEPPEITPLDRYSLVLNDPDATQRVVDAFRDHFGSDRLREAKPTSASEDFGVFGAAWQTPSVFWFVGGTDPQQYAEAKQAGRIREIPTNHNPAFAPVLHPTLETGVATLVVA
ncbi:MAG TPA: M20 family metallopeptidase, partial [Candidatus Polarisedimenticolia bacterium]|nr:M20 family metallopeptidase [Candidatus Polarisedimenticolia bacterium]